MDSRTYSNPGMHDIYLIHATCHCEDRCLGLFTSFLRLLPVQHESFKMVLRQPLCVHKIVMRPSIVPQDNRPIRFSPK